MSDPQNPSDFDYNKDETLPDAAMDDADYYMDDEDPLGAPVDQPIMQNDAPSRKSRMTSLLIIGVGAVIGLGGIFFFLTGGDEPAPVPQSPADMAAITTPDGAAVTDPAALMDPSLTQQPGGLPLPPASDMPGQTPSATSPDTLATMPPVAADGSMPLATAPADPNQILATELPALAGSEATLTPDTPALIPSSPTDLTAANALPATPETPAVAAVTPAPAPVSAPVTPTPTDGADAASLAALNATLVKIDERLQTLEGRLDTQSDTQAKLAEDINALKSSTDKVKAAVKTDSKPVIEEVSEAKDTAVSDTPPAPKKVVTPKKKRALTAEDKAYVPPAVQKKPVAATAPASNPTAWQLRGAAQGKAWVAKTGSSELLVVNVGDTLPGLGQISAITNTSGKWVVQGQTGQITD
ncbi:MAG: hypothetical protein V4621_01810 [Pseudomonadota bacterium]